MKIYGSSSRSSRTEGKKDGHLLKQKTIPSRKVKELLCLCQGQGPALWKQPQHRQPVSKRPRILIPGGRYQGCRVRYAQPFLLSCLENTHGENREKQTASWPVICGEQSKQDSEVRYQLMPPEGNDRSVQKPLCCPQSRACSGGVAAASPFLCVKLKGSWPGHWGSMSWLSRIYKCQNVRELTLQQNECECIKSTCLKILEINTFSPFIRSHTELSHTDSCVTATSHCYMNEQLVENHIIIP